MKKFWMFAALLLTPIALAGCGGANEGIKVGLIVSAAGANDNGYNQFAIEGLNQAKAEFDITTQVVTTADDVPGSLEALASEGFDLVFSLEYNFAALITDDGSGTSIAEKYPDTTFVIFNAYANRDGQNNKIHDNVVEVLFNVNEGSFLAGALSVLVNEDHETLFTDSAYNFTPTSTYRGVGFVGGTQSDGITVFSYGYAQGVNHIASELDVTYNFYETYAAGFGASPANYNTIDSYYDAGVNTVFAAAGGVATNLRAAASDNGKLAIDVDANQDASVPGHILTSVLKNTNVVVYDLVEQYLDESIEAKATLFYDLSSGATGITDLSVIEGFISTEAAAQTKWTAIKARIADLVAEISDGTIDVIDAQAGEAFSFNDLSHVTKAN